MGTRRPVGCLLTALLGLATALWGNDQPTTAPRSLAEDMGAALRKRISEGITKSLRERAAEYQPTVDNLRKRSADEIRKLGQWEYKVVPAATSDPGELTSLLNKWGEQGWECFQVTSAAPRLAGSLPHEHLLFFRKPRGPRLEHLPLSGFVKMFLYLWAQRGEPQPAPQPSPQPAGP